MRFLKNAIFFLFCGFVCFSQEKTKQEKLLPHNDDLKYVLTYTFEDTVKKYEDESGYKAVKIFYVFMDDKVSFEDSGRQTTEFYYFVTYDTGDIFKHLDSDVYKTERLLDSKVEEVKESEDKKSWLIKISHVPYNTEINILSGNENDYVKDLSIRETKVYKIRKY